VTRLCDSVSAGDLIMGFANSASRSRKCSKHLSAASSMTRLEVVCESWTESYARRIFAPNQHSQRRHPFRKTAFCIIART